MTFLIGASLVRHRLPVIRIDGGAVGGSDRRSRQGVCSRADRPEICRVGRRDENRQEILSERVGNRTSVLYLTLMGIVECVEAAASALETAARGDLDALSPTQLDDAVTGLVRLQHQLDAATAQVVSRWDADYRWMVDGSRSAAARLCATPTARCALGVRSCAGPAPCERCRRHVLRSRLHVY